MAESELHCENCQQPLDPTDKFCRECGLPTVRRAQAHIAVPGLAPDTGEMKRALDAMPDPRPFLREEPPADPSPPSEPPAEPLTTSDVVRATNPTFASQLASSTMLMVVVILVLAVVGVVLLFLAFR